MQPRDAQNQRIHNNRRGYVPTDTDTYGLRPWGQEFEVCTKVRMQES